MKPANFGYCPANQLENAIIKPAAIVFKTKSYQAISKPFSVF